LQRGAELPREQRELGARRLGILGLLTAPSFLVLGVVYTHGNLQPGRSALLGALFAAAAILSSLAIYALSRRKSIDPCAILRLGVAYQLVIATAIALGRHFCPWQAAAERGWSGVAAWVIIFAVIVPGTPARTVWVSTLAVAIEPLVLIATIAAGNPAPSARVLPAMFGPSVIAVLTATVAAHINYRMGRRIEDVQEMGSYKLVELLGEGGMGQVWRAEHKLLARPAAIKLIRPDALGDARGEALDNVVRRFEREAQATALLQSEHTIELYDFGVSTDGSFYYVMELLDGMDLERLVRRHGRLPPERAVHLLLQVCDSLAEAHANGLIHRDIKPANIHVCQRALAFDHVKVLDFGLVKPAAGPTSGDGALTAEGSIRGTPAFMVPEIIVGDGEVDGRADLYAVGCVGYWLLSGRLVFEAESAMKMIMSHASVPPPPLSTRVAAPLPPGLEAAIHACLEKEPSGRPRNATELAERLARVPLASPWTQERAREWWEAHGAGPGGTEVADPLKSTEALR
jgi:serine/threonine-protein kinase